MTTVTTNVFPNPHSATEGIFRFAQTRNEMYIGLEIVSEDFEYGLNHSPEILVSTQKVPYRTHLKKSHGVQSKIVPAVALRCALSRDY